MIGFNKGYKFLAIEYVKVIRGRRTRGSEVYRARRTVTEIKEKEFGG